MVNPGTVSKGRWLNIEVFRFWWHLTFDLGNNFDNTSVVAKTAA